MTGAERQAIKQGHSVVGIIEDDVHRLMDPVVTKLFGNHEGSATHHSRLKEAKRQ